MPNHNVPELPLFRVRLNGRTRTVFARTPLAALAAVKRDAGIPASRDVRPFAKIERL